MPDDRHRDHQRRWKLSRFEKVLLGCLLTTLLVMVAGCGGQPTTGQGNEWNRLADQRAVLIDEQGPLHERILGLLREVMEISPSGPSAADALPLLEDREATIDKARENERLLAESWSETSGLEVGQDYKTFARQQEEIAKLYLQWYDNELEFNDIEKIVYGQGSDLSSNDQTKLAQELADLSAEAEELASRIDDKEQASEQYWNDEIAN